ncbi:uncharacterized protein KY384_008955 [Bacidia gigantensis]|uniref:uncharacterized protein n=1 Tax=Bacidia gigantensis TaxID=2732470 RepID=UPI001D05379D|nr:uncharacterized protein KY384_008955 [Bacidia gigantensis]KAG8525311.1 hypothetical protein KY384_008955 [Bacidia gigantensis]
MEGAIEPNRLVEMEGKLDAASFVAEDVKREVFSEPDVAKDDGSSASERDMVDLDDGTEELGTESSDFLVSTRIEDVSPVDGEGDSGNDDGWDEDFDGEVDDKMSSSREENEFEGPTLLCTGNRPELEVVVERCSVGSGPVLGKVRI